MYSLKKYYKKVNNSGFVKGDVKVFIEFKKNLLLIFYLISLTIGCCQTSGYVLRVSVNTL